MSGSISYADLRDADFGPLGEAVAEWGKAPGKFDQIGVNFGTEVTKGLAHSNWEGEAADAAWRGLRRVRAQIQAAEEEARRVHRVMSQALEKFKAARKVLEDIETELAGHEFLRLDKRDGSVSLHLDAEEEKKRAELEDWYRETIAAYAERTRRALTSATEADSDLAQALTTDVNGTSRGFNDRAYDTLVGAREASEKDLQDALRIARTENGKLPSDDFARLTRIVARHSQDAEFAERFALRMGPEGTLKLFYNATHPRNLDFPGTEIDEKEWQRSAKVFQKSLGTTLATASHADSPAMREWQTKMIAMGDDRLESSGGRTHPFGFQLMSNLMRHGTYDGGFLNRYGDKLLAWDKKENTRGPFPYWANQADTDSLNPLGGGRDTGHDAVVGFLEGLGHNPEAATRFFEQPGGVSGAVDRGSELNDRLKYLTQDRNWDFDGMKSNGPGELPGHDALGHALTAATTGYAYDADELTGRNPEIFQHGGDRRTAATAGVMEQVVHVYGGEDGPKLLHEQPAMAASLGAMGGAYVDDLNRNISGVGESLENDAAFPAAYKGHADFGRGQALDFLSVLGQDKTSHALMNQAEHLYTLDRFAQHPPSGSDADWAAGRRVLLTEAEARGTLDHARVQQIEAQYNAESAKAQDAFRESANWTRVGMTGAAPGVTAGILSVAGKSGPWGVAIPIVTGATTEFSKLFHDDVVFGGPDMPEPPKDKDQFFARGENELGAAADRHLKGRAPGLDPTGDLADAIKSKYLAIGPQGNAFEGREPYVG
ncbi:PPE domain-containing protein [Streptomyces albiaxialis]|uniref:PPE domain-containing protein n=1 Tax=Streptomyces albiaxialis TaxID=329523 RepID=A0ABN2VFH6_9ACTN